MSTTKEERAMRVSQMRANFAHEGGTPDVEHEALLEQYIEGNATLADLYTHAREYVYTAQQRQQLEIDKVRLGAEFRQMRVQYEAGMKIYAKEQEQKNIDRRGMSKEQRERHEAVDAARANVELSGFAIGEVHWQQSLRWANGEITTEEYLALRTK